MQNNREWADLHTHTTFSDGSLTPEELVRVAKEIGLKAIAITDHDTVDALATADELAAKYEMEIIPAIELGTQFRDLDLHFLGYFIDPQSEALNEYLMQIKITRKSRARAIIEKLDTYGLHLAFDEVLRKAGAGSIGRPHIAAAMVEHGLVSTYQEAFDLWIGDGRPAHVLKGAYFPRDLIRVVHQAGGIAVLAHPGNKVDLNLFQYLVGVGLDGVEVVHPSHDSATRANLKKIARQCNLLMTGGSDFHGFSRKNADIFGNYVVPYKIVNMLKQYKASGSKERA